MMKIDAAAIVGIRVGTCTQRPQLAPRRQIRCRPDMPWIGHIYTIEATQQG